MTDPEPLSYQVDSTYDAAGNKLSETDRRGDRHRVDLRPGEPEAGDPAGRGDDRDRSSTTRTATVGSSPTPTATSPASRYDERNLLTAEDRPLAAITHHTLDDMGDRASTVDPEGRMSSFAHDARRRLVGGDQRRRRDHLLRLRRQRQPHLDDPPGKQRLDLPLRRRRPADGGGGPARSGHRLQLRRQRQPDLAHRRQLAHHRLRVRCAEPDDGEELSRRGGRGRASPTTATATG